MLKDSIRTALTWRRAAIAALLSFSLIAVACSSTLSAEPTETGASGKTARSFEAETFEHGTFSLDAVQGKPVVINFWFPSCPPCAAELPDIQAAYLEYGDAVEFIGVQQLGLDSADDGRDFLHEVGVTYPNLPDRTGEVWVGYGVNSFPTTVFLDSDHRIQRTWTGLISAENLRDQIEALLGA